MAVNELVKELLSQLQRLSGTDTVTGKVRSAGDTQLLPLTQIGVGFGAGMADGSLKGKGKADGGLDGAGAGGAATIEPRAFIAVGPDGRCEMLALRGRKGAVTRRGIRLLSEQKQEDEDDSSR